jgi:hypothetical protein
VTCATQERQKRLPEACGFVFGNEFGCGGGSEFGQEGQRVAAARAAAAARAVAMRVHGRHTLYYHLQA